MFTSKKIVAAAAAGVLGGFALIGAAGGQAFGRDGSGQCVEDSKGNVRCVWVSEYKRTTDEAGNTSLVNKSKTTCSGSGQVSCGSSLVVGGKKNP